MSAMGPNPDYSIDRGSELPLGTQLVWKIRALVQSGELSGGDRLPSVRSLAERAGVNVNTVRAVYGRLEEHGVVTSEQGRGTFVAAPAGARRDADPAAERPSRAALRREIERLEAELARRPQPPSSPDPEAFAEAPAPGRGETGGLLSAEELQEVRDSLIARLDALEQARLEVTQALQRLDAAERVETKHAEAEGAARAAAETSDRSRASRSVSTLGPVRVRWVGG